MVIRRRRTYGRSYANRQRYRRRRGRYGRRRFPKKYRTRLYLGAGKKYAGRSKYAGRVSKLLRRRGRSRKIFKTGDLAKYKGVQAWITQAREAALKSGETPADENASIFYNTTLTNIKIMLRLLWKEAKFVYLYRNRVRLLPKIYELASTTRGILETGTNATRTIQIQGQDREISHMIRLNEDTVPNENWKELRMMVKLVRKMNPQNDEWMTVIKKQQSALQLATLFTVANLGIQRMDNFLRAAYAANYMKVAGNILLALVTVTKQVADEYNIIPIISINYINTVRV